MDLPIVNQNDPKHFLPPQEAREKINNNQLSLKDIVDIILDTLNNPKETDALLRDMETDKEFILFDSKVRSWVFP